MPLKQKREQAEIFLKKREQGVVKAWIKEKGYGFIERGAGEKDIFVHHTGIDTSGFRKLVEGELVSFAIGKNERGPIAIEVRTEGETCEN